MSQKNERGIALIAAILIMMLVSALLMGFTALVVSDNRTRFADRERTQAFYGAQAGLEQLVANLGNLFTQNYSPTGAQIDALAATPPSIPHTQFASVPNQPGYTISYDDVNPADGNPDAQVRTIASGPYQGFVGLITQYTLSTTARTTGNAEVRLSRKVQTVGIPVFQFGIYSENDLSFFAGPDFNFGGRVHSNQNVYLAEGTGASLTLADKVTAVGEVIRTNLANGRSTVTSGHQGRVIMARAPNVYRDLGPANCVGAACEGSLQGTIGSAQNEPTWTNLSIGTYNGYIRNGRTGARRLDLPLVRDGAVPLDIIRRPNPANPDLATVAGQRFFNMASLRILLSDTPQDILNLPGVTATQPISLESTAAAVAGGYGAAQEPLAMVPGAPFTDTQRRNQGYRATANTSLLGGFIKIEKQTPAGVFVDVTAEILNLGITGRNLTNGAALQTGLGNNWAGNGPAYPLQGVNCLEPSPNAVIRLQRLRDVASVASYGGTAPCGNSNAAPSDRAQMPPAANANGGAGYWPNVLYDPREAVRRDDQNLYGSGNAAGDIRDLYVAGIMHYVELDVNNLRRWLAGQIGANGPNTMNVTGFVVYFSDRRGNRGLGPDGVAGTADDPETGELGFEDFVNPGTAQSTPNNALDVGEDLNGNGVLEVAGDTPVSPGTPLRNLGAVPGGVLTPAAGNSNAGGFNEDWNRDGNWDIGEPDTNANGVLDTDAPYARAVNDPRTGQNVSLWNTRVTWNVARMNRPIFFRRALKIVNGGLTNLPANGLQGLTVASENPVYVVGNFNACGAPAAACAANGFGPTGDGHVSAAVIADAVTLLGRGFNDLSTFERPHVVNATYPALHATTPNAGIHVSQTTWYRLGIISGKGLNFPRPTTNAQDNEDFGTDGGAHNFLRYIQNWGGQTLNYRGSIISFYTNRQAVGTYKCCDIVYSPPTRGYNFDAEFLNPNLLPPRTPMFRDVNSTGFTQTTSPCGSDVTCGAPPP